MWKLTCHDINANTISNIWWNNIHQERTRNTQISELENKGQQRKKRDCKEKIIKYKKQQLKPLRRPVQSKTMCTETLGNKQHPLTLIYYFKATSSHCRIVACSHDLGLFTYSNQDHTNYPNPFTFVLTLNMHCWSTNKETSLRALVFSFMYNTNNVRLNFSSNYVKQWQTHAYSVILHWKNRKPVCYSTYLCYFTCHSTNNCKLLW